ncbi:MAG: hypothetical protein IT317_07820 [Anaerolineales bacterium]|nr:hypothetical protein [Anaerolineales bacterium]
MLPVLTRADYNAPMLLTGRLRRLAPEWPVLAVAALAIGARLLPTPRTIDDAFITFRYARNLVAGAGFVYNLGERVLGTTTPLYTLLLAALAGLSGSENYPWLALLVNSLADALTCGLLAALGRRLTGRRAVGLAAALLWAVAPMSVTFAIGGMETSVCILGLTATAWAYLTGRPRWTAAAAALTLLTRPDAALLIAPLLLDWVARSLRARAIPWAAVGLFAGVLAPWVIFAVLYFGSPWPHSLAAKALAYRLQPTEAAVRLLQHYGTPFFEDALCGPRWPLVGVTLYLALSIIGGLAMIRREPRAWLVALYPWLYGVVFAAANPLIFRWYLAPPLPFYYLTILAGLNALAHDLARALRLPAGAARAGWGLPALAACALLLNGWTLRPDHGPQSPAPKMAWHQLELYYTRLGQELARRVTPRTVIAAGDVGALGYYSNARILDTVGLMSPEATAYYPLPADQYVINYAMPAQLILAARPDFVVLLEVYGRRSLLPDPDFQAAYALEQTAPTDIYGSRGLLVYHRRSP